jgi:uncharacterized membrane protein YccC
MNTDDVMPIEERLISAIESLGDRLDRMGEKFDAMARADIAARSDDDVKAKAVRQFVNDVLDIKEKVNFIAQNTRRRGRKDLKVAGR